MKRFPILLICLCSLVGCATTPTVPQDASLTAGNALLATQGTIINTHEAFRTPCKDGSVPVAICHQVDAITIQAGPAYDAAATAAQLALQSGGDPADATAKKASLDSLLTQIINLAKQYEIIGGAK
jgi:hypothetical protein